MNMPASRLSLVWFEKQVSRCAWLIAQIKLHSRTSLTPIKIVIWSFPPPDWHTDARSKVLIQRSRSNAALPIHIMHLFIPFVTVLHSSTAVHEIAEPEAMILMVVLRALLLWGFSVTPSGGENFKRLNSAGTSFLTSRCCLGLSKVFGLLGYCLLCSHGK